MTIVLTGLFPLGVIVATPPAIALLKQQTATPELAFLLLARHVAGDWGDLDEEDKAANDAAINNGDRILSSYTITPDGQKVWIITEWDRSATTILLPEDY